MPSTRVYRQSTPGISYPNAYFQLAIHSREIRDYNCSRHIDSWRVVMPPLPAREIEVVLPRRAKPPARRTFIFASTLAPAPRESKQLQLSPVFSYAGISLGYQARYSDYFDLA